MHSDCHFTFGQTSWKQMNLDKKEEKQPQEFSLGINLKISLQFQIRYDGFFKSQRVRVMSIL